MTRATWPSTVRGPRCEVSPLLSMARMVSALFPFSLAACMPFFGLRKLCTMRACPLPGLLTAYCHCPHSLTYCRLMGEELCL